MATGFGAWTDAGEMLFDANNITYGLISSGTLERKAVWRRWSLRSAQLDPNDPSSYAQTSPIDVIHGFDVLDAVAPIPFIHGFGVYVGSQKVDNVTTFFYMFATPATKFYCFDTMRSPVLSAGLKCFSDDAANTCTFNSAQIPLNIVASVACPPPGPESPSGYWALPMAGCTRGFQRLLPNNEGAAYFVSRTVHTIGTGNYAVATNFSRSMAMGRHDSFSTPGGYSPNYIAYMGAMDGAYGVAGGLHWVITDAARTQMIEASIVLPNGYGSIPRDRYPVAMAINIDNLPNPYSAFA